MKYIALGYNNSKTTHTLNIGLQVEPSYRPRLLITVGEPAGIGPDLVIALAHTALDIDWVVIADPELLEQRAVLLKQPVQCVIFDPEAPLRRLAKGQIYCWPCPLSQPVIVGALDVRHAGFVMDSLRLSCAAVLAKQFDAMVTGPVNKAILNQAGYAFTGHTEFLAELCAVDCPVMMLASDEMRVVLATTHLPLSAVSVELTSAHLENVLRITDSYLRQYFALPVPRMLICGLNPHAGEGGHLGREEIDRIQPVIKQLCQDGLDLTGPVSADTAFSASNRAHYDVFVAMYHDQGLPVLKTLSFGGIVNITLGLPIIRTSVDHGTALSIAGTGEASVSSLLMAVQTAAALSCNKQPQLVSPQALS